MRSGDGEGGEEEQMQVCSVFRELVKLSLLVFSCNRQTDRHRPCVESPPGHVPAHQEHPAQVS